MTVIDEYLNKIDVPRRDELERIRRVVKSAVPDAEEVISYGMPGFKYRGKYLAGFNCFRDHLSFFPTSEPIELLKNELQDYKLSRGTIQFGLNNPIPEELIKELVNIRARAITS